MKILFVCKYNRFRSKVAEAMFNFYNSNKKNEAKSAGTNKNILKYAVPLVHNIMEEKRIPIDDHVEKFVNFQVLDWTDKIIIVADNVSPEDKIEVWNIQDYDESEEGEIKKTIEKIEQKIKQFITVLGE